MIEVLLETTGTVDGFAYQPHIYYVDKKTKKLVAFKPVKGETVVYAVPKMFDQRYRKFKKIKEKASMDE